MLLSFRQFINEQVNKSDIQSLRKEAQMFSKNIRRINDGHDLYAVAQAYAKWIHMLETKIYEQMLGLRDHWQGKPEHESYESRQVREKVWNLVVGKNVFTPQIPPANMAHFAVPLAGEGHAVYRYDDTTKAIWDEMYTEFDRTRSTVYNRYVKNVRDAFNAVDEWLKEQPDTLTSHRDAKMMHYDGVAVSFVTTETATSQENTYQEQKKYLDALSFVLKRYRQLGLGHVVDKLIYEYDRAAHHSDKAGEYISGRILSYSWDGNTPQVIAHEVGHHLWKILTEKQRQAWTAFIKHDLVSFSESDYAEIHRAFNLALERMLPHADEHSYTTNGVWANVTNLIQNPVTKELWDAYCDQRNHLHLDPLKKEPQRAFERFKQEYKDKLFPLHAPTEYSGKNEEEAWCETTAFYVIGRRLKPLINHVYETVSGFRW